jgi:hypothetical protein
VFPRILPVENHRDGGVFPAGLLGEPPPAFADAPQEVVRGMMRFPGLIVKPDAVRQRVITEQQGHSRAAGLDLVRAVQKFRPQR